tara:strand:+ start:2475 stop:3002 length:528 start_codon:yes stop_codon:yes gene_type:complete
MNEKTSELVVPEDWVEVILEDVPPVDVKHRTKFANALEFISSGANSSKPYIEYGSGEISCPPCQAAPGGIEENGEWLPIQLYNTGWNYRHDDRPHFVSKPPCYKSVDHKMVNIANRSGRDLKHISQRQVTTEYKIAYWFNEACRCKSCDDVRDAYHLEITGKRPTDIISVVQLRK